MNYFIKLELGTHHILIALKREECFNFPCLQFKSLKFSPEKCVKVDLVNITAKSTIDNYQISWFVDIDGCPKPDFDNKYVSENEISGRVSW